MFTANSMNCLAEALGMALPGNGTILATSADRKALLRAAAAADRGDGPGVRQASGPATACCRARSPPPAAFDNAMILDMAMGGSTNTVLHILAIAHEAGVPFTLERIDALSQQDAQHLQGQPVEQQLPHRRRRTTPAASTRSWARSRAAARACSTSSCLTVTGKTLGENIEEYDIRSATASADGPAADRSPSRRRADQPGLDRAQRGRRSRSQAAGLALLEAEGEDRDAELGDGNGSGSTATDGGDGFDPFDVIRDGRQRLLARPAA